MVDGIKNWSKLSCVGVFFKYNNIFLQSLLPVLAHLSIKVATSYSPVSQRMSSITVNILLNPS